MSTVIQFYIIILLYYNIILYYYLCLNYIAMLQIRRMHSDTYLVYMH